MPASSAINRFAMVAWFAALASVTACHSQTPPTVVAWQPQATAAAADDTVDPHGSHPQWDTGAKLLPHQPPPPYPVSLQRCGVEGSVMAAFVIDEKGRAVMSTFTVMTSDDPLFTAAVRAKLPTYRFAPATLHGKPVRVVAKMPFNFRIGPPGAAARIRRPPDPVRGLLPISDTPPPAC